MSVRRHDLTPPNTSVFNLPDRLSPKAEPALIAGDERHFAAVADSLARSIADLTDRIDAARKAPGRPGQEAMERDLLVHQLTAELRALRRFGLDVCLGHMVSAGHPDPVYIGRLGLMDADGRQLLVDWRSPVAEPFFGATHANPMGLTRRRRYRWTRDRVNDYWDEVFTTEGSASDNTLARQASLDNTLARQASLDNTLARQASLDNTLARQASLDNTLARQASLDHHSAFIASLGSDRSSRMRDVLGTIAADQDAIIRAGSRGALVVDGGPGTGKTVVALHRAAYLLYSDPRLRHGVLFVGPHEPYLSYVADVLPNLGEESVQLCTLLDLVPEGATAATETDPEVARLKSSADLVAAIESAVRFYEEPPATGMTVCTEWSDIWLSPDDWAEAFAAPEPGTAHNDAREQIWDLLLTILIDKDDAAPAAELRTSL